MSLQKCTACAYYQLIPSYLTNQYITVSPKSDRGFFRAVFAREEKFFGCCQPPKFIASAKLAIHIHTKYDVVLRG